MTGVKLQQIHRASYIFVTGNIGKFCEVRDIWNKRLGACIELQQRAIDLAELQSADPTCVIGAKLDEAYKWLPEKTFFIEDTSLFLDALVCGDGQAGLPGPLVKWFIKTIGCKRLAQIAYDAGIFGATAQCTIGLIDAAGQKRFFTGKTRGTIVPPHSDGGGFGWDPIFKPEDQPEKSKTFAQMSREQKGHYSMRGKAANALITYIQNHCTRIYRCS